MVANIRIIFETTMKKRKNLRHLREAYLHPEVENALYLVEAIQEKHSAKIC